MKLQFSKIAAVALMLTGVSSASATLIGQTLNLTAGGSLAVDVATLSATVIDSGPEYELCVAGPAGCASGLKVLVDVDDFDVAFTLSGTTGSVGSGESFNLELEFPDFTPSDSIGGVAPPFFNLDFGTLSFTNFVGSNAIVFEASENSQGEITHTGTVRFALDVPEPGALALLGLALVGMGFVRRRAVR